jgi:hypothetical protein
VTYLAAHGLLGIKVHVKAVNTLKFDRDEFLRKIVE